LLRKPADRRRVSMSFIFLLLSTSARQHTNELPPLLILFSPPITAPPCSPLVAGHLTSRWTTLRMTLHGFAALLKVEFHALVPKSPKAQLLDLIFPSLFEEQSIRVCFNSKLELTSHIRPSPTDALNDK
jgi:hypothetical protein